LASVPASTFSQGVATANPTFTFTNPQTIPSTILLRAVDTDGVSSQTGSEGSTSIASGRLRLLNVYGSDQLGLSMPLTAQIWNTDGYVLNTADNCTTVSVPTSGNGLAFGVPSLSGKAIPSLRGLTSGSATLLAGDGGLKFSAPGSGNYGYVDVTIAAPSWLQFPWKGAGNLSPTGRATFGIYKSPLIYRRENY
jgi:MSHA biogenesis protein MshQ